MKNDRGKDIDPDLVINQLLSQDQSAKHGAGQLNIKHIRERFLNALKEVSRLEKVLEEKNTQLAISAKEKDRLINALNKAFEDRKRLHDRLSDFDILRNMEIAEFKQSAEKIVDQLNRIHEEKYELLEDIFEKDRVIDDLKKANKKKELQLQEVQTDLYTAFETLKGIESRYKELEANYKVIEQERDNLREKLNAAIDQQETGVLEEAEEYRRLLEISTSEKEAVERRLSGLREQMAGDISEYQTTIEKLTAEKDELNLKLTEAGKELSLLKEENAAIETLKEIESRYNDLQANYRIIEHERDSLKEKLNMTAYDLTQKLEAEYQGKIEALNNTISDLMAAIGEKADENITLKNEISSVNLLLDEKEKEEERFNAERASLEKNLQSKDEKIENLTDEKTELETEIKRINEEFEKHKNEYLGELLSRDQTISELKEQIDKVISEYQADMQKLADERDELKKLIETEKELALIKEEDAVIKALRDVNSRYNELESNYKAIEQERDDLEERLKIIVHDLIQKSEAEEAEYRDKIEELDRMIAALRITIDEKINENASLKNGISLLELEGKKKEDNFNNERINLEKDLQLKEQEIEDLKSQHDADIKRVASEMGRLAAEKAELETGIKGIKEELERRDQTISKLKEQRNMDIAEYQTTIEKLTAGKDELNLKLADAEKELALIKEENIAIEALREVESRYKELEVNYKVIEQERVNLEKDLQLKEKEMEDLKSQHDADIKKVSSEIEKLAAGVPEKSKFYLFSGLAVCIVVMAGLWLFNIIETKRFDAEMSKLNKQKIEPQQKIMLPPPVPAAISVGEEILDAMEKSPKWTSAISEILAVVPEDVRLSSIESSEIRRGEKEDKGIKQVDIKGFSTTELGIADLVSALKASHFFYDVEIVSSQKGEKDIAFELKTRLKKT